MFRLNTAVLACSLLLTACPDPKPPPKVSDDCEAGTNMGDVHLDPSVPIASNSKRVVILYSKGIGPAVPQGYFDAVRVDPTSNDGVESVSAHPGSLELTLNREIGSALNVRLLYPDRRQFISCRHPGMADEYVLRIQIKPADGGYRLTTVDSLNPGAM